MPHGETCRLPVGRWASVSLSYKCAILPFLFVLALYVVAMVTP